jgi:hypothetical protein
MELIFETNGAFFFNDTATTEIYTADHLGLYADAQSLPGAPCLDLNGDQQVDGADLGLLLGAWGTPQGDLNADGVVDGADLGLLLGAWGACS